MLSKASLLSLLPLLAYAGPLIEQAAPSYFQQQSNIHGLFRRLGEPSAGIGIELENRNLGFKNEKQADISTEQDFEKVKAKPMSFPAVPAAQAILDAQKEFWTITAEHSGSLFSIQTLIPEFIVNGLKMKVGRSNPSLQEVGAKMTEFLVPCCTRLLAVSRLTFVGHHQIY